MPCFYPFIWVEVTRCRGRILEGILLVIWGSASAAYIRLITGGRMTLRLDYWIIGGDTADDAHGPFPPMKNPRKSKARGVRWYRVLG